MEKITVPFITGDGVGAEVTPSMQAVVEDPTVNEGIAGIGHIPGWHDLEESEELHQKEYDELVEIAKSLDMYVQG